MIRQGCTSCGNLASRKWREKEKMKRKWERMRNSRGNGERIRKWREIHFLHFLIFSLFPPSLSISYIKNCHILSQNVKYGTFVANVTKNLTYALWGNNSGSNSVRGSSASCAGLASNSLPLVPEERKHFQVRPEEPVITNGPSVEVETVLHFSW